LPSENAKHANSPAATGGRPEKSNEPQAQPLVTPSEEAKHQWAGAKGPAQSGKP
jgi:hypothetical protein